MPRFSIIVPTYNAEDTLPETLDAVLAQQFDDWECVVVDDGSIDRSLAIAREYSTRDSRVVVLSQSNMGTAGAYNTGVCAASGDLVVICSADDILLPKHLVSMAGFVSAQEDYDIYSTNGFWWREDDSRELVYGPDETQDSVDFAELVRRCFYSVGTAYRRELFDAVGGYRLGVFGEDYDFWLRAMAGGARHRYLPVPLSLHRLSTTQKSARLGRVYRSDIRMLTDLKAHPQLSDEQRAAIDDGVRLRRRMLRDARTGPLRRGLYRAWVGAATPVLGEDKARQAPRAVKAFVRRWLPRSGR